MLARVGPEHVTEDAAQGRVVGVGQGEHVEVASEARRKRVAAAARGAHRCEKVHVAELLQRAETLRDEHWRG